MKALKDSSVYVAGEVISKSVYFLLLPYLSRKLGAEGYGELSYYQTLMALFGVFLLLGQDGGVARYFYRYGSASMDLVVRTGYAYTIALAGIMLVYCYFFSTEIIAYLVISSLFSTLVSVQLSIRQCQKRAFSYMFIQLLSTVLSVAITVLFLELYTEELPQKRILAVLASNVIVFFIAFFLYRKEHIRKRKFSWANYKIAFLYVMGFGLPLLLHHISGYMKGQVDRIFIHKEFTEKDLGLYAMGANIAFICRIIMLAVSKALLPYYYENLKKRTITLVHIKKWVALSFIIVPIPSLILWVIPESVLLWVLGNDFVGVKYFAMLFLISVMLILPYLLLVNYLFYYAQNKIIGLSSIYSTIFYLVALLILIFFTKKIEYIPYASIIGAISILPILYIFAKKVEEQNNNTLIQRK